MKRSYVLSALVTLTCFASLACGGWSRPDYYVFSAFNRNQMGETFTARTLQFWKDYTGEKLSTYDMSGLVWVDPDEFENSQNTLIKTALQRNDREILDYLRLLTNYLKQCQTVDEDIPHQTANRKPEHPTAKPQQPRTSLLRNTPPPAIRTADYEDSHAAR